MAHCVALSENALVAGGSVSLSRSRMGLFTVCDARSAKLN